jgi:hypothetical protein
MTCNITLDRFLGLFPPEVRDLALQARELVQGALPGAIEVVDPPSKIIAYGYGQKYKDLICAIAPTSSYVNLIFSRGVVLPDPAGLLSGTGKRARHVKIQSISDIAQPGVRALLDAAAALYHDEIRPRTTDHESPGS